MGGHSHWKGIKEKKGALDKKRGKLFAKLLRAIEIAARQGDPNPDNNPTLWDAIQRAKDASMPKDNIERAVARAKGGIEGENWENIFYEGYGAGGVAVYVEALTNNRNRTSQDLRAIFRKHEGSLAEPGAVAWLFERRGVILVDKAVAAEDDVMSAALDGGADDVVESGDEWEILTQPIAFHGVKAALEAAGISILSAEVTMRAQNNVPVTEGPARSVLKMIDALEDHDDVQAVYANFDIPDSVLADVG
ncbi:MAG TPA: YebC/PmpR family DNA-binding transcriptional regulator [Actinomycetota bacterium]|nr:YebC/PmpR family DNA-binding transcriptional regulator [Actinomycetota bacterium]